MGTEQRQESSDHGFVLGREVLPSGGVVRACRGRLGATLFLLVDQLHHSDYPAVVWFFWDGEEGWLFSTTAVKLTEEVLKSAKLLVQN